MSDEARAFKPALIVVDFQEDFCPPNGALAVPGGRDIAPTVNALLSLPFTLKIGTRDWHPPNHISFLRSHASTHPPPTHATMTDPRSGRTLETRLWPTHCVRDTWGAQFVPELDAHKLDIVVDKGTDAGVEMYSAFKDAFGEGDSGLAGRMRAEGVTHVFVVGLAAEYCVKWTAEDARREGFEAYVVREGTRGIDGGGAGAGEGEVGFEGEEVGRVRVLAT